MWKGWVYAMDDLMGKSAKYVMLIGIIIALIVGIPSVIGGGGGATPQQPAESPVPQQKLSAPVASVGEVREDGVVTINVEPVEGAKSYKIVAPDGTVLGESYGEVMAALGLTSLIDLDEFDGNKIKVYAYDANGDRSDAFEIDISGLRK